MKKTIIFAITFALAALLFAGCGNKAKKEAEAAEQAAAEAAEQAQQQAAKEAEAQAKLATLPEEPVFMVRTNYGNFKIKLYSNTPQHRDNFAKLALSGFYDGVLFHRVINGFMIQGGDPLSKNPDMKSRWGTGGPGYTVPAEFRAENKHKKGAIAAARTGDAANPTKASSGSQFYIVQDEETCAQLDGNYTVYGETIEGIATIDKIAAVQTDERDRPLEPVKIISIKLDE